MSEAAFRGSPNFGRIVLPTRPPVSQPSGQRAADKTDGMEVVVRRVRADEGLLLKSVRLSALADSPSAFGSSYAAEADQPDEHWTDRATLGAAGERSVTFFAMVGESVVGLVSAYRPDPAGLSAELVSMWVSPAHRRAGIAIELVMAVVGWAHQTGMATVELWVTRGNDAAVRLYETAGFCLTGDYQPLPSDPCKDELRMRLLLD
jgi:ribosomal protein S18 acetylase RimI-like enzyme